jgi:hypothetical protein
MGRALACMGEGRVVHRVLVGKPEGTKPLGRPRRRWEDNNKRDLQEVGGDCVRPLDVYRLLTVCKDGDILRKQCATLKQIVC